MLNVDGCYYTGGTLASGGGCIRNTQTQCLCSLVCNFKATNSLEAKCLALWNIVIWAKHKWLTSLDI